MRFFHVGITEPDVRFLEALPALNELWVQYPPGSDLDGGTVSVIGRLFGLRILKFWACGIDHDDFSLLTGLVNLESLDLYRQHYSRSYSRTGHKSVRPPNWQALAKLPRLHTLNLSDSNLDDQSLQDCAACKQVRELNLSSNHITDSGVVLLAEMSALQSLGLQSNQVHGETLELLADLTALGSIDLDGNPLLREQLQALRSISPKLSGCFKGSNSELRFEDLVGLFRDQITMIAVSPDRPWIDLNGRMQCRLRWPEEFRPERLRQAAACPGLTKIDVQASTGPIRGGDFAALGHLSKLTFLRLHNAHLSAEDLRRLSGLQQLQTLAINESVVDAAGLKHCAQLPSLERVDLRASRLERGDEGLRDLQQVRRLDLQGASLDIEDIIAIGGMQSLETLSLQGVKNVAQGLRHLSDLPRLAILNLKDTDATARSLIPFAAHKDTLRHVSHEGSKITDEQAQALANEFGWKFEGPCSCGCMDIEPQRPQAPPSKPLGLTLIERR